MKDQYDLIKYAELEAPPAEKNKRVWFGLYRGVRFEINNFSFESNPSRLDKWTHYLIIPIDDQLEPTVAESLWLPPEYRKFLEDGREYCTYNDYESPIRKIEFHGGCTWYSKESSADEKHRVIKVGCDYQHAWDEGRHYDLDYVYREVKESINSFITHFGPIKVRSWGDGKYRFLEKFKTEVTHE